MCGAAALAPSWDRLIDRDQLIGFMEKWPRRAAGHAITSALKHYKTHLLKDATSPEQVKTDLILTAVQGWKSTLRKEMQKVRTKRIQDLSNEDLSLDENNQLVECGQM